MQQTEIQYLILDFSSREHVNFKKVLGIDFNSVKNGIVCSDSTGKMQTVFFRYNDDEQLRLSILKQLQESKAKRSRALSLKRKRCEKARPGLKVNIFTSNRYKEFLANVQKRAYRESQYKLQDSKRIANSILSFAKTHGFEYIVIEDLNLAGMQQFNGKMVENNNWGQLRACIETKAQDAGIIVKKANRYYASSQICSKCGYKCVKEEKLSLRQRIFKCPKCKNKMDRDKNAAINLAKVLFE